MQRDPAALKAALADLEQRHLRRTRRVGLRAGLINFCSNDYLGLSTHPEVVRAFSEAAMKYGVGSGASHLVSGHGPEHEALEQALAAFTGRERALVYSTGYMANLGVIGALADQTATVVADKLNHASLIDGGRLTRAHSLRYRHGDSGHARELLAALDESIDTRLLITDGVFSMDGDVAPLPELARAARESGAWLIVDDAHGLGVLGSTGRGTCEHFNLDADDVPVLVGTFGKAFGTFGAFVAGDADLIEFLIQKSRTYVYTTALPPAVAAATRAALEVSQRESWRREKVLALAMRFRRGLGLESRESQPGTTIIPVVLGDAQRALAISAALEDQGFLVSAIRPPTVPAGTARLRVTLSAAHEEAQVDALIAALRQTLAS
ncbi:MAG TPA: 8-amino-7-oxononanoate synthase [Steroidobacteraceae bacterium]|jgi:8-amino-7-oxononanoate synthase|nr:8-amino-7-oxononanoate synthase [Steroidobacteraceae bacterium]